MSEHKIFFEKELDQYLLRQEMMIDDLISKENDNYILNVNETEFINFIENKVKVKEFEIFFDDKYLSNEERLIPAEYHPFNFDVERNKKYPKQVIKVHVPFSGDSEILVCGASTRSHSAETIYIEKDNFYFEIIVFTQTPEEINRNIDHTINNIKKMYEHTVKDINNFNSCVRAKAVQKYNSRKDKILKTNGLMSALNIPLKMRDDIPKTFSISSPTIREKINVKPIVTEKGYTPDPTLDSTAYNNILRTINDMGKVFERLPSTYKGKDEESLRDHIIMHLEPLYEGTVTGETFNKSGKTDILIRYESTNVFVAECKFWKGGKVYLGAISQLLNYLTWRDSKAAVIMFVTNKDFSSVVSIIKEVTKTHDNYLGYVNNTDETWFNYRFHINEDKNREVKLAVMLYHIPK